MGAVWLAAKHIDYELPRDDSAFCNVFYTYIPGLHNATNGTNGKCNGTENGGADGKVSGSNGKSHENGKCNGENGKHENGVKVNGVNGLSSGEECGSY